MDADHNMLLFHTNIRRLPKRNVTEKVFELGDILTLFFEKYGNPEFFDWLNDDN